MTNLFSIFDPQSRVIGLRINWVRVIILLTWVPAQFWLLNSQVASTWRKLTFTLHKEFELNFAPAKTPGHTHWAIALFMFILLNNVLGLTPYTFTASRHLSFTLTLGISMWVGYFTYAFFKDITHSLAHFVPLGTPYPLMPFMVLIEIISRFIRPLTLSVRLAANIVAGHLLLTLIAAPIASSRTIALGLIFIGLVMLIALESAVALIQAYVFSMLRTLYLGEVNYNSINYLCNSEIEKFSPTILF